MPELFSRNIDGWPSWGEVFCDLDAFAPPCREILKRERMDGLPRGRLTPGTNAVFSAGPYVLKIFAPLQSGLDTLFDYRTELAMLRYASGVGIHAPRLKACGEIRDRYLFRYLIVERVEGTAGDRLLFLTESEQDQAIRAIVQDLARLHGGNASELRTVLTPPPDPAENERWTKVPAALADEMLALSRTVPVTAPVPVHGDLTRDNLLLRRTRSGVEPVWIDFADSHLAPACYELPPLVFELLMGEGRMVRVLCGEMGQTLAAALRDVLYGLSLHDFGADILRQYFERRKQETVPEHLETLERYFKAAFFEKDL